MLSGRIKTHWSSMARHSSSSMIDGWWSGSGLWPRTIVVAMSVVFMALGAACGAEPPSVDSDDPGLVLGRSIYASNCASCHGADGSGGVGTVLRDGAAIEAYPDPADQAEFIRQGKGRMPGFDGRLSDEELDAVIRYTREAL